MTVFSNDPTKTNHMLEVKAHVRVPVEVTPSQLRFGRVSKGSDLTREVRIRAPQDPGFAILEVSGKNPLVSHELETMAGGTDGKGGEAYLLKVSLNIADVKYGTSIRDNITLKTTSEKRPTLTIPVEATVTGDVFVTPNTLTYTGLHPNRKVVRYVVVRNNGPRAVNIVEVRNPIEGLEIEVNPLEKGKQYRIKATLDVGKGADFEDGEVTIVTDHPEQPELSLKVAFIYPRKPPQMGGSKGAGPAAVPPAILKSGS